MDWNITKLRLHGLEKFEVLKSQYDELTKKYELEIKFDGPRFEGSYSIMNNASDSRFDVDFDGYLNFNIKSHPAIMRVGWTFGTNETTKALTIANVSFTVTPEANETKSIFDNIFDKVPIPEIFDLKEDIHSFISDYYSVADEAGGEILQAVFEELVEVNSVSELAQTVYALKKKINYNCFEKQAQ